MTDTTTDELRRLARALGFVNFDDDAEEIVRLALEHAASWKARAEFGSIVLEILSTREWPARGPDHSVANAFGRIVGTARRLGLLSAPPPAGGTDKQETKA